MQIEYNGETYEFTGLYRVPMPGDDFLSDGGEVIHTNASWPYTLRRAIVHKLPKCHDFGGIRFMETGEFRIVQPGEWYMSWGGDGAANCPVGSVVSYTILRPVEVL